MEPGHEDREYRYSSRRSLHQVSASMEPGHEDREYRRHRRREPDGRTASMEPGHEDREYSTGPTTGSPDSAGLNGARS